MTVRLRPLIKPDGRISRIRLSGSLHREAFGFLGLGLAIERALELSELFRGCYLFRAITRSFTPLLRVRTSSVPSVRLEVGASLRVQCPEIEPTEVVLIMNASDSQTDRNRRAFPTC